MPLLFRIYAAEGVNGDKRVYVDKTTGSNIKILSENEIIKKYFVNVKIYLKKILTLSEAQEEVEKLKKKYRDDGWKIIDLEN